MKLVGTASPEPSATRSRDDSPPPPTAVYDPERKRYFLINLPYERRDIAKSAGCRWDPEAKQWHTSSRMVLEELRRRGVPIVGGANPPSSVSGATVRAPPGMSYFPFQVEGIKYLLARRNSILADEMGLGKTVQVIGLINSDDSIHRVLIVCQAGLRIHWLRQLKTWLCRPLTPAICQGDALPSANILIANYEWVVRHRPLLDGLRFDLLVCDEAHYLKNAKAKRTQAILGGGGTNRIQADRRVFVTGTPVVNRPYELWPIIRAIDPKGLGGSWNHYVLRYCGAYRTEYGWDVSGATNLDELSAYLRGRFMIRRLKSDVLSELPPKRRYCVFLEPTAEAESHIARERMLWEQARRRHLEKLAKLRVEGAEQGLASMTPFPFDMLPEITAARQATALCKVPQVVAYVRDRCPERVVIMTWHREVAEAIAAGLPEGSAVVVHGQLSAEERQRRVDRFQNRECPYIVGTIAALGVGISLTAASTMIFAELDWSPGQMAQAEDRIHRMGQTQPVEIVYLVYDGTVDGNIGQALVRKWDILRRLLGGEETGSGELAVGRWGWLFDDEPAPAQATHAV